MKTHLLILCGLLVSPLYSGQGKLKAARREERERRARQMQHTPNRALPFIAAVGSFFGVKATTLGLATAASIIANGDKPLEAVLNDDTGILLAAQTTAGLAAGLLVYYAQQAE